MRSRRGFFGPTRKESTTMKRNITLGAIILCSLMAGLNVYAQDKPATEPAQKGETAATSSASVSMLLALDWKQIEGLDRLYDDYLRTRLEQERKMADWQDRPQRIKAWTTPDEREIGTLENNIKNAEQKIADAFLKARADALKALTPEQRAELEAIRAGSKAVRDDRYRRLLALNVEDIWKYPAVAPATRPLPDTSADVVYTPPRYRYYSAPYYYSRPYYYPPVYWGYGYGTYPYYGGRSTYGSRRSIHFGTSLRLGSGYSGSRYGGYGGYSSGYGGSHYGGFGGYSGGFGGHRGGRGRH